MSLPYFDFSFGRGLEGLVNYASLLVDGWFVIAFALFIWIAIVVTLSKRDDRQYPIAAIVAFASLVALITLFIFKLATAVSEFVIFLLIIIVGGGIVWGIWQTR